MAPALTARLVRRSEREALVGYLGRNPLSNLFLLDLAERLGWRPAPGELRTEIAVARRDAEIAAAISLRPTVVLDADAGPEAIEAFVPLVEALGVGLVKSPALAVDALWRCVERRAPRQVLVDRYETAFVLRAESARLRDTRGAPHSRPATEADLEPLVLAARESLREEDRPDPFAGDVRNFRRWVRGRISRARVVESDGRIVFVGYADVRRPDGWLVQGIYTWPEARRQGFAAAGVSDLCREAFAAGADHVQLAVVEGNLGGQRLYEGLGFKPFERLRTILFTPA